jgi:hypothetical protein
MSNGEELTANHWFSLAGGSKLIGDQALPPNGVNPLNRKVRVQVRGAIGQIVVGPNPSHPVNAHGTDYLIAYPLEQISSWVQGQGGTIFTAEIVLPEQRISRIAGSMMIFDAIGNLVYSRKSADNLMAQEWESNWVAGETRKLAFYWNGITDRELKAAPGMYRLMLVLSFDGIQRKYTGTLGVGR